MIITLFGGGIGNQMFQYAFGHQLSIKNNQQLKLDISRYTDMGDRLFRLNQFNITGEIASIEEIKKYYKYYKSDTLARRFLVKFYQYKYRNKKFYERPFIMEPDDVYLDSNPNILSDISNYKYKNVFVRGFWQSEKYFKDIENIIRKEFTLKEPQDKKYYDLLAKISNCNSISIIVRRGDYLKPESLKTFYQCPPEYFLKGAEMITKKIDSPKLIIISDGMDWVKKNIKFPYPCEYVPHEEFADYQKLMFMSACKHHVISNSTFAWWIAWLCQNPNKIVIAPKNWFTDKARNEKYIKDLLPESWIKI